MLPYDLLRPVPLDALRPGIPGGDATRAIQHEDRDVLDVIDQLSEGLRGFAGDGNGGHYALRQHDDKYDRAYISCKPLATACPVAAPQHWKPAWRMSRGAARTRAPRPVHHIRARRESPLFRRVRLRGRGPRGPDRKSTRLNSSHTVISYAVFCLKKKKKNKQYKKQRYRRRR